MRSKNNFIPRMVYFVMVMFLTNGTLLSQFSIVSTSPAHGSQNVDTASTFSITFNAPIDTSARFNFPEDFFVNMYFQPLGSVNEPDSITLSQDMQTVYYHNLHLEADTKYFFVFVNAVSQSGDSLENPYSIVFSTGSTLETSTISGTINYPGNNPAGTLIALFDDNPFGVNESVGLVGAIVPTSSGFYTVQYIENGIYWPAAIKNFSIDDDGDFHIDNGSLLGFFDSDLDKVPDSVEVINNSIITNVDMQLFEVFPQTAKNSFSGVQSAAVNWASDSYLVRIGTFEMDSSGTSLFWQYSYYSPSLLNFSYWFVTGNLIANSDSEDEDEPQIIPLPINWMDSDSVLAIVENEGGSDFRNMYPDTEIRIRLGFVYFVGKNKLNFSYNSSNIDYKIVRDKNAIDPTPSWMVEYGSDNAMTGINFILDPETGEILNRPQTAATAENITLPIAKNWASDADLFRIENRFSILDTTGKALLWDCMYYSVSKDSFWTVRTYGKIPAFEGPPNIRPNFNTTVVENWIDSDIAFSTADNSGGSDYRIINPTYSIFAELSRWHFGSNPDLTVWSFTYSSATSSDLTIIVNAENGTIVNIEDEQVEIPLQFLLSQNFPNPFNPTTTIKYQLPKIENRESVIVQLNIYDVLGREVETLVNENQNPGNYEVVWDAGDLSSGVYFYQLTAGSLLETRKMMILK